MVTGCALSLSVRTDICEHPISEDISARYQLIVMRLSMQQSLARLHFEFTYYQRHSSRLGLEINMIDFAICLTNFVIKQADILSTTILIVNRCTYGLLLVLLVNTTC